MNPSARTTAIAAVCFAAQPCWCSAQVFADWVATTAAAYDSDSSWSIGGQPPGATGATPDTLAEGARFAQPGLSTVELTAGATTTVGGLVVSHGSLTRLVLDPLSPSSGVARISSPGDLVIDNARLELSGTGSAAGGVVDLTAGSLRLSGGGSLDSLEATSIQFGQTILAVSESGDPTRLNITSTGTRQLGDTSIGESGAGTPDPPGAELLISSNAVVETGDLSIATSGANDQGAVSVFFADLTQTPAAKLTIGGNFQHETGRLQIGAGAEVRTGAGGAKIQRSGTLRNSSGSFVVNGNLLVDGGRYLETNGASRDLSGAGSLQVLANGAVELGAQPLSLIGDQSVAVDGGTLTGEGGLTLGPDTTLTIGLDSLNESLAPIRFGGEAVLDGVLEFNLSDGVTPSVGDSALLLTAASLLTLPSEVTAPPLPAGLDWELQTESGQLRLLVVGEGTRGDFNGDGLVDAADYTIVRDTRDAAGLAADLDEWRLHFGDAAPETVTTATPVPEPGALLLAFFGAGLITAAPRRARSLLLRHAHK